MSRARKAREAVIPRDEDFARWRKLIEKSIHPEKDFDKFGRKLWGHADETKRVYSCSADHTLHIRSFVRLRPLLEWQRRINGGKGELPALECCKDGRTVRFARDPSIPEDEKKRIQEEEAHGDNPGHTASLYAYRSCRLYDHKASQDQLYSGFVPQALNVALYGGKGCLVVYGEKGSGKSYTLFGTDAEKNYECETRPHPNSSLEIDGLNRQEDIESEQELQQTDERFEKDKLLDRSAVHHSKESGSGKELAVEGEGEQKEDGNDDEEEKEMEEEKEEEHDVVWLADDDAGNKTGILQRSIRSIFHRCRQGKLERQSRYRVEMNALMFTDGMDQEVGDLSSFDENGKPKPLIVRWEPDMERFEAEGCNFVTYHRSDDMIWAALRANWMRRKLDPSGENTTIVYRIRVHIRGIGDPTWKDLVGDQLDEGQPAIGEFMILESSGFSICEGFPDAHTGNDGVFQNHETLRMITKVLESVKFNNLPALRKKHAVPYRMNPVTRLMSSHLKQGAVVSFLGCAGVDKASHVGTLHTLWCASSIQKPRTHVLQMKRAKTKLKVVALMAKQGAVWASRSKEEKEQRRTEAQSHVFDHVTKHMDHLLSDKHKHLSGQDEWSVEHQNQLHRARPRLERRMAHRISTSMTTIPEKESKPSQQNNRDEQESEEMYDEETRAGKEDNDGDQQKRVPRFMSSHVTNWIKSRNERSTKAQGPKLKGSGGKLDEKGYLSPYVHIMKMPEVHHVPPPPVSLN